MNLLPSSPANTRRIVAASILGTCFLFVFLVKEVRYRGIRLDIFSSWIVGVLPNFICLFALPQIILVRRTQTTLIEYMKVTFFFAVFMIGYEVAQIWMPRRTFDWADIATSISGAALGIIFVRVVYFRRIKMRQEKLKNRPIGSSVPVEATSSSLPKEHQ